MWYLPKNASPDYMPPVTAAPDSKHQFPKPTAGAPAVNLKQCWFPGVHCDVGGGYNHEIFAEFSDITLAWMIDQCQGMLAFDEKYIVEQTQQRPLMRQTALVQEKPNTPVGWATGNRLHT